jgi:uncharacterized protein (DUF2267 family)
LASFQAFAYSARRMEELINQVMQRTGLSQENAQKAVEAVIDVLKQKLPAPIASHIDSWLSGGLGGAAGELGNEAGELLKGALGSLFGGKK